MNCYDCYSDGDIAQALSICHDCGAGVCADHATETQQHLTATLPMNLPVEVEPPQRRIRCRECQRAVNAMRKARSTPFNYSRTPTKQGAT